MVRASEQAALASPRAATSPPPPLCSLHTRHLPRATSFHPNDRPPVKSLRFRASRPGARLSIFLLLRFSHRYSIRYCNAPTVWRALRHVLESCTRRRRTRASRLIYAGQRARTKATSLFVFDETVGAASSSHHGMRRQQRATVNSRSIL